MDLKPRTVIGILGGSYDPPHAGHLALAQAAQAQLGLNELRILPNAKPWQKTKITPAQHRVQMLKRALHGIPHLKLDQTEINRDDASYTVDTLRALRAQVGHAVPLVWIMGSDQFARLDTWHQWDQILELAHIAVAHRAGHKEALNGAVKTLYQTHRAHPEEAFKQPYGAVIDIHMPAIEVSATQLRQLLGNEPAKLNEQDRILLKRALAPRVLDYIQKHHLYLS